MSEELYRSLQPDIDKVMKILTKTLKVRADVFDALPQSFIMVSHGEIQEARLGLQRFCSSCGISKMGIIDLTQRVCGTSDPLKLILRGGNVKRYHTEGRTAPDQTNAEHSWRVFVILTHIWPDASQELKDAVIYHDTPEGLSGDPPKCLKESTDAARFFEQMDLAFFSHVGIRGDSYLSEEDMARLRVVDVLECYLTMRNHPISPTTLEIIGRAQRLLRDRIMELSTESDRRKVAHVMEYLDLTLRDPACVY